jgi:ATP synthase H subunit
MMMENESEVSKHQHSADEFLTQVRSLKDAEQAAAARVEEAKKEAMQIEASAREQSVEILNKAQLKAVEAKNELFAKRREETDGEIHNIMGQARKQAATIKQKSLTDSEISTISQSL